MYETEDMRLFKADYMGQLDSYSLFAEKYLVHAPRCFTTSADISKAYRVFCFHNEYEPLKDNQWPRILKRLYGCVAKTQSIEMILPDGTSYKKSTRGYLRVALSENVKNLFDNDLEREMAINDICDENK